jgi:hypothetical protein
MENQTMTDAPARQSSAGKSARRKLGRSPRARAARAASYKRRLAAAGLTRRNDDDRQPRDMDALRDSIARRIAMAINEWRGCKEPLCRRNRGCMAPNISCSNARPLPPVSEEERARRIGETMLRFRQQMEQSLRECGEDREPEALNRSAPPRASSRRRPL